MCSVLIYAIKENKNREFQLSFSYACNCFLQVDNPSLSISWLKKKWMQLQRYNYSLDYRLRFSFFPLFCQ